MAHFQAATAAGFQGMFQAALGTIEGLQTEVLVFVVALLMHSLVFCSPIVPRSPRFSKGGVHLKAGRVPQERPRPEPSATSAGTRAAMLELRAAISSSDLDRALNALRVVATPWKASLGATPSGGPRHVLQQLLRLAAEQSRARFLLDELAAFGLATSWVAEVLLDEAARLGCREALDAARGWACAGGARLGPPAFCALVRGSRTGAEARGVLADAVRQRAASEDVLATAAEAARAHGDPALAGDALRQMPAQPGGGLAAAAVLLAAEGLAEGQGVLGLYEERLRGADLLSDPSAARHVADAVLRAGRQDLLRGLLAASPTGARQVGLLRAFGSEGRLEAAEEVFKACKEKTACLYNALLDAYVGVRDLTSAERLMRRAADAGLADVISYNIMVKAHLHAGDIQRARSSIDAMRSVGLTPSCVTFNELVDAAFKSDRQAVWPLIDEMQACGLKPNQVTCSILLKNLQRTSTPSDVRRALAVLDAMGEEVDDVLLSCMCEACIRSGQQDLLRQQLRRHCQSGLARVRGAHTFGSVIRAYGFVGDLQGVWAAWGEMQKRGVLPTSITLGCMVEALVVNDGPDAGYEVVEEMLRRPTTRPLVNAVIYCSVLKGFAHQKKFERVWAIYQDMRADIKALQFSAATYNLLIDVCARSCHMARVPALLNEMSEQRIEPNVITFSTIVKGYCQENQLDKAFDLLEDMKSGKFKPDEITYNTLLDGCARHGLYERGIFLLQDMQDAGVSPSNFTLSVLVKLAGRSHRPDKAFELCADISKKYRIKPNVHVYNNLVNACIQHGEVSRAMIVFERFLQERVRPDARTYTLLLRALLATGDAQGAAGLLRDAHGLGGHPAVRGGLPSEVLAEALEGIAGLEAGWALAAQLVGELRRLPGVKLDPRLAIRLAPRAA